MKRLKLGVLGCASIAERLMIPAILQLQEDFEIVGVASRSLDKAKRYCSQFNLPPVNGYQTLLDNPEIDVIYMPLPTGLHEEWIVKCLYANKHILAEKSIAMDFASAQKIVSIAKSKGLVLMESFMFCYHSQHNYSKKLISSGAIGSLRLFRSQFGFPPLEKNNFRYDPQIGGGALLDAGAYTVRAAQLFLGNNLEVLSSELTMDSNYGSDIYGSASLLSEQGIVAQLSFGFDNFYQCNYEFWGSKGRLKALKAFTPKPTEKPLLKIQSQGKSDNLELDANNHFKETLLVFRNAVIGGETALHYNDILMQSDLLTKIKKAAKVNYI